MSLVLAVPAGLAALAACLVPLLLHLARREARRSTDFAALRWLVAGPRLQRRRRFEERLLLAVRLLLLVALALLLAQPMLAGSASRTPWIVAMPGVPAAVARTRANAAHAQGRWLATGFPSLDDAPPPGARQPVASLLRELDATLPRAASLTVLAPAVFDGADAQRPRLSRRIDWQVFAREDTTATGTQRARATGEAPAIEAPAMPMRLEVRAEPGAGGLRYLRAAGVAWQVAAPGSGVHVATPDAALPAGTRHLAWLVPGTVPEAILAWGHQGGQLLLRSEPRIAAAGEPDALWTDANGEVLVRGLAYGRGRVMWFTRPIAPAAMPALLDAGFPSHLCALFADASVEPARVAARDYAPVTGAAAWQQAQRPLAAWLAWLAALLFLVERWLASGPRQGDDA